MRRAAASPSGPGTGSTTDGRRREAQRRSSAAVQRGGAPEPAQDVGVSAHRQEDDQPVDGLEPELRQADEDERVGDESEEEGPERGPDEGARATEDADAPDDDRGDDLQRVAPGGGPVDGPELDDVHDPGDPRQQAAHRERDEDDQPRGDTQDAGRLGVAADGVELPSESRPAKQDRPDHDDDDRDDDEDGDPEDVVVGGIGEARWKG